MYKKFIITTLFIVSNIFNVNGLQVGLSEMENLTENQLAVDAAVVDDFELDINAKAVVLMEKSTGKVLYAENANERLYPASVTKIMSVLLVCEAIESGKITLEDNVVCSKNAASKGGSQIWLEEGEVMSIHELLKATCIYSANDACTLLGEYVAGSETEFNKMMNERAGELGMTGTHFDNCTGLDDTTDSHLTTALDVAIMSRELIKYDFIKDYTTVWMDTLRNGETQLVNTNKLVRFYEGITGLKTGTTDKAGCCVSATAMRNGMELIAVVMGSENSNDRFDAARKLLDWGFANFEIFVPTIPAESKMNINVRFGMKDDADVVYPEMPSILINKSSQAQIEVKVVLNDAESAPLVKGQTVGHIVITNNGIEISSIDIISAETVEKLTFFTAIHKILTSLGK